MLRRCIARSSICPQSVQCHRQHAIRLCQRAIQQRAYATEIKAAKESRSGKWKVFAVIGLVGFTVGSWYRILGFSKKSQDSFQPFELVSKEQVSSTASIFTIKTKSKNISTSAWKAGIWNVEFKQPQLQIVRAYTPLPPLPEDVDPKDESVSCLRFLIRKDARGGEMSSYLHNLPTGAEIELRGPNVEYIVPKDAKNVVFVAGGTGIAPAMQVAYAMFDALTDEQRKDKKLHIMWANRQREDCAGGMGDKMAVSIQEQPVANSWSSWVSGASKEQAQPAIDDQNPNTVVQILNQMKQKYRNGLTTSYFVDAEKSYIHSGNLANAVGQRDTSVEGKTTQVIVSGPPGFITYIAGPKVWQDGAEQQGVIGGRLAQVLERAEIRTLEVWKV